MIRLTMIGYIGKDCETKTIGANVVISFSVLHSEKYTKDGQEVKKDYWVRCHLWRKPDKVKIAEYLTKGIEVFIEGAPTATAYTNKEGALTGSLECNVSFIKILTYANKDQTPQDKPATAPSQKPTNSPNTYVANPNQQGNEDDDLPF